VLWFARHRLAGLNGWILAAGGVGAVFSTTPVEWTLQWIDWRVLFTLFALAFALTSALIFVLVPERREPAPHASLREQLNLPAASCGESSSLKGNDTNSLSSPPRRQAAGNSLAGGFKGFLQIGRSREFWRIAPLGMLSQSAFMALQGLWAASWMKDVALQARGEIAYHLLLAAVGMVAGHLTMGNLASRLGRAGIAPSYVVGVGVGVAVLVHTSLVVGYTGMQPLVWLLFGFLGTAGTVNFAILAQAFPASMAGRASTALNLLIFVASFLVQWGIGIIVNHYPAGGGRYAPEGYALAFGVTTVLQAIGVIWFFRRMPRQT
jgi:hypothetical protein